MGHLVIYILQVLYWISKRCNILKLRHVILSFTRPSIIWNGESRVVGQKIFKESQEKYKKCQSCKLCLFIYLYFIHQSLINLYVPNDRNLIHVNFSCHNEFEKLRKYLVGTYLHCINVVLLKYLDFFNIIIVIKYILQIL